MKRNACDLKAIFVVFCVLAMSGCGVLRNVADNVVGSQMRGLKRQIENGKSQVVDYGVDDCFDRVVRILGSMNAEIVKVDIHKYSILAIVSLGPLEDDIEGVFDANSADVGIFFVEEGPEKTMIEIASLSSLFVDFTAERIFSELKKEN